MILSTSKLVMNEVPLVNTDVGGSIGYTPNLLNSIHRRLEKVSNIRDRQKLTRKKKK
ncbi:hypothetical protein AH04_17 [Erwinia phage AH04]|uniref:Uncharacterized protein n=1 Tax=Erwinia phage AH04 TaxID=2869569 RepID=A0AAE8BQ93_9CAUD|nr:hypothetical protein PQC02_gp017 [Erwinia phage AH04]QZA70784.1 hypothetical protein AH04_17 [Erwinia phage AH04]